MNHLILDANTFFDLLFISLTKGSGKILNHRISSTMFIERNYN